MASPARGSAFNIQNVRSFHIHIWYCIPQIRLNCHYSKFLVRYSKFKLCEPNKIQGHIILPTVSIVSQSQLLGGGVWEGVCRLLVCHYYRFAYGEVIGFGFPILFLFDKEN